METIVLETYNPDILISISTLALLIFKQNLLNQLISDIRHFSVFSLVERKISWPLIGCFRIVRLALHRIFSLLFLIVNIIIFSSVLSFPGVCLKGL